MGPHFARTVMLLKIEMNLAGRRTPRIHTGEDAHDQASAQHSDAVAEMWRHGIVYIVSITALSRLRSWSVSKPDR